jgi:hypothetical protein
VQNNLYYLAYNAMSSDEPLLQTNGATVTHLVAPY